jgi:Family of unknown function (DUF5329)
MMRALVVGVACALLVLQAARPPAQAQEKPPSEKQKIEALINHVEDLKDVTFVRNDKAYDAKTAAKFLRGKWAAHATTITTVQDFIEQVGSVSSTTGKPYMIQFKDGKHMKSGDYLFAELKKLEQSFSNKRDP